MLPELPGFGEGWSCVLEDVDGVGVGGAGVGGVEVGGAGVVGAICSALPVDAEVDVVVAVVKVDVVVAAICKLVGELLETEPSFTGVDGMDLLPSRE